MPVIIRELHIKTSITDEKENVKDRPEESKEKDTAGDDLVALFVEQVMQILKDKEER